MIVVTRNVSAKRLLRSCLRFLRIVAEIRYVAHKKQTQLVSPVVEARLIYLDVESEEVESEFFCAFDVSANGFICQERIHAFGVKRLIERTKQVDRAVVEVDILIISTRGFRYRDFPHSEVGKNPINHSVGFRQQFKSDIVEVWSVYVPQAELFWRDIDGPLRIVVSRNFNRTGESATIPTQ